MYICRDHCCRFVVFPLWFVIGWFGWVMDVDNHQWITYLRVDLRTLPLDIHVMGHANEKNMAMVAASAVPMHRISAKNSSHPYIPLETSNEPNVRILSTSDNESH